MAYKCLSVQCIALAWMVVPTVSFGNTIFPDGTFNLADYTNPFTYQSGPISGVVSQCSSCGNPGQALSTALSLTTATSASSNLDIGLLNTGFTYDPSTQGDLASIDASVDSSTSISIAVSEYNLFDPLIEQDGNYYYAELFSGPGNTGFVTLSSVLSASDFDQFNPTTGVTTTSSHPNFSGDAMEFGIIVPSGSIALPSFTQTLVYDNLSFDLTPTPEPASLLVFGAGLIGLTMMRRRRRV